MIQFKGIDFDDASVGCFRIFESTAQMTAELVDRFENTRRVVLLWTGAEEITIDEVKTTEWKLSPGEWEIASISDRGRRVEILFQMYVRGNARFKTYHCCFSFAAFELLTSDATGTVWD